MLLQVGRGSFLAKTDIKSAFRIIPIHPDDYHLLGFTWREHYYFDRTLPMGLSSSCQIFEEVSTAIQWIAQTHGNIKNMLHLLDDFLIIAPDRLSCQADLSSFQKICSNIGVPLAPEKTEGPATCLSFAGIELDSVSCTARLPQGKLQKYRALIAGCKNRKRVTLRELQSLIGALSHCVYIIPAGRPFLRRLIDLTIGINQPHCHIRLNKMSRADLDTWDSFLQNFNGRSIFLERLWVTSEQLHLYTDSSRTIGFGATLNKDWFAGEWPTNWKSFDITVLELYPIVASVHVWRNYLSNRRVVFHTDNQALVYIINKLTSKDNKIMTLIRHLTLQCLSQNILFKAVHIPGVHNVLADALSRSKFQLFRQLAPSAHRQPAPIPHHIVPNNWKLG